MEISPEVHRKLAADLFNGVWELLEKQDRTASEDLTMLHQAHASRFHWGIVGKPRNLSVGEWQISRVYSALGRAEPALFHGRRCLEIAEAHSLGDFYTGYAHEALARAHMIERKEAAANAHLFAALGRLHLVNDAEDRGHLAKDLDEIAASLGAAIA